MYRDVVVVGAGVFGVWTAMHLHAAGVQVTLVDAYGPASSRSSSGDESRILRCGYGPDAIYSRMAWSSLKQWRSRLARGADAPLWHPCGVLWMAGAGDAYFAATQRTLEAGAFPLEVFDTAAMRARYPHLETGGIETALFEPECGVLMARRAVQSLADDLVRNGVRMIRARVEPPAVEGPLEYLRTRDGGEVRGDAFIFACGAWLATLLPGLSGVIRPTRQVVVYFGVPPGDSRFGAAHTPAWVEFPAGVYGVPDLEGRGVKVGIDQHGPEVDPDTLDRIADAASVERARAWLAHRMPAMANAPVVETRVCQYENTSTGDFLIDACPGCPNVWIVGGGSGHGFKHGPAVGELAARLVVTGAATEPRFAFRGRAATPQRVVY